MILFELMMTTKMMQWTQRQIYVTHHQSEESVRVLWLQVEIDSVILMLDEGDEPLERCDQQQMGNYDQCHTYEKCVQYNDNIKVG
jgi:hypothetical protein